MALEILWYDGFEQYAVVETTVEIAGLAEGLWAQALGNGAAFVTPTNPATGAACLRIFGASGVQMRRSLGGDKVYPSAAFRANYQSLPISTTNASFTLMQFRDDSDSAHININIGSTGRVVAYRGGMDHGSFGTDRVLLGTSTREVAAGAWNHFEIKVYLHASAGYVKVRVNGDDYLNLTGINTINSEAGQTTAAQLAIGCFIGSVQSGISDNVFIDDLVAMTNDGDEWLGQYGAYYLKPNADTATHDWVRTSGPSDYLMVNEIPPDDNTNFLFSSTVGNKTKLVVEPLPTNIQTIAAVMVIGRAAKTDSGVASIDFAVVASGVEHLSGAPMPLVIEYDWYFKVWQLNPETAVAWNPIALPDIEIKRTL